MAVSSIAWTPEIILRLRTLWAEGISTAAIGIRLGVSKNAVVGKAHRLNLPARPSPIQPGSHRQRPTRPPRVPVRLTTFVPARPAVRANRVPPPARVAPPRPTVPLTASPEYPHRERTSCCWPIGEPGRPGFSFCGHPTVRSRPYCEWHGGIAYVGKTSRRRNLEEDADALA